MWMIFGQFAAADLSRFYSFFPGDKVKDEGGRKNKNQTDWTTSLTLPSPHGEGFPFARSLKFHAHGLAGSNLLTAMAVPILLARFL
jgi:hypothetical protein